MKKVIEYLVLVILVVCLGGLWFFVLSPDYKIYALEGKSMEPNLNNGDLLIFKRGKVEPGAVVTFRLGNRRITHQVVAVLEDQIILTKGDANKKDIDPPARLADVEGIYYFHLPFLGYLMTVTFKNIPLGFILIIAVLMRVGGQIYLAKKNKKNLTARLSPSCFLYEL
jgi:signal peptidase